jgi:glycosyltransferase involved in cell wall biosynthesis
MSAPTVAVIVAALDEAASIGSVIATARESPLVTEIIVADGGSTDGTVDIVSRHAEEDPRVTLLTNLYRHQSAGLNLAASAASAEVLVRLDAHTEYAEDYIARSVDAWRPGVAVGGPMRAVGTEPWSKAIANAMADPLAIGPARFRHAVEAEEVDTVYLGTFARSEFLDVGAYRTFPSGTVEDADFYARWRARGKSVRVDPSIRSSYHPRRSLRGLWRQYRRYGAGKAELLWVNGRLPSPRALAPASLVGAIVASVPVSVLLWPWATAVVVAPWGAVITTVGLRAPTMRWRTAAASASMHLAYGLGTWIGLLRGAPAVETLGIAEKDRRP